jgi:hypothetical protein
LLAACFVWLTYALTQQTSLYERAVGWVGLPCVIYVTVMAVAQLLRRKPTVVIGDTGILDCRLNVGEIPWSDIVAIEIVQNGRARISK